MAGLKVVPADDSRSLSTFLRLPFRLYRGDPNWVPPLLYQQRTMFDRKRFPFHFHSEVQPFLCLDGRGRAVGRICAVLNRRHLDFHGDGRGFFGFFECEDDPAAAALLLDAAAAWLKERGCTHIRGPANFSTNEECGLLVEGFDSPPVVMMTYNPPYYMRLLERWGLAKAMDLLAFRVDASGGIPERLERAASLLTRRLGASVRSVDFSRLDDEMELLFGIYNSAWEKNWGFVPMTREEFFFSAKDFSAIADPELVLVLEMKGEPVGFSLALPDVNLPLSRMNGRLFPFGFLKFLYYRRKIRWLRVVAMGLVESARGKGADSLLYLETFRRGMKKGYEHAELSWVLETNVPMIRAAEKVGAVKYKTYRFYEREI